MLFLTLFATCCYSFGTNCSLATQPGKLSSSVSKEPFFKSSKFKVAFVGDIGLGSNSESVLRMIKNWGADLIVIPGDFDYVDNPVAFLNQFTGIMGLNYPLLAVPGNHDILYWFDHEIGYKALLEDQLKRSGLEKYCNGDMGINSYCLFNNMLIVLSGAGTLGINHAQYIDDTFNAHNYITWKVCIWHKNQAKLQTGDKEDETGYLVYEICRKHGAIIITGHEHSYERTHLLSNFETQEIASAANTLNIKPGVSFAAVVGLGGDSIREWKFDRQKNPWWAAKAALDNGVSYGALLCSFDNNLANCAFEDIKGVVWDQFKVHSTVSPLMRSNLLPTAQFQEFTMSTNVFSPLLLNESHNMIFHISSNVLNPKQIYLQVMLRFPHSEIVNGSFEIYLTTPQSPLYFNSNQYPVIVSSAVQDLESGEVWVSPNLIDLFPAITIPDTIRLSIRAHGMDSVKIMSLDDKLDGCLLPTLVVIF